MVCRFFYALTRCLFIICYLLSINVKKIRFFFHFRHSTILIIKYFLSLKLFFRYLAKQNFTSHTKIQQRTSIFKPSKSINYKILNKFERSSRKRHTFEGTFAYKKFKKYLFSTTIDSITAAAFKTNAAQRHSVARACTRVVSPELE